MGQRTRIKKVLTGVLLSAILLECIGCGKTSGGADGTGRYSEETIALPAQFTGVAIAQEGDTIRLLDEHGADLLSTDGGKTFSQEEVIPEAKNAGSSTVVYGLAGAVDGTRIFTVSYFGKSTWKIITGENERIFLEEPEGEYGFWPHSTYAEGYFYPYFEKRIYKTDADTGETSLFVEADAYPIYLAVSDRVLYVATVTGLLLYDLDSGERLAKQDEVLDEYLKGKYLEEIPDGFPMLLYPYEDGVYVLAHDGLYWHTLYGDTMELVLDTGLCGSIGEPGRGFLGMAVAEGEEGRNTFLVLYSDGKLVRYAFGPKLSQKTDLKVYSVYEDINMIRAVNAYREAHPKQTVVYEVGYKGAGYGLTLKDVLNNLSTEIAAGTGPDILVMDGLPFQAYADKGVLMDLAFLRDTMTEDTYFTSVVDGFSSEEGLYAMPLTFVVPVIGGDPDRIGQLREARSLSDLADLLDEVRKEMPGRDLIGFWNAEQTLSQLSQASMGAWMDEEGSINREAVTEFLTQAKRIYDTVMDGAPVGFADWYPDDLLEYLDAHMITRTFGQDLERPLLLLNNNGIQSDRVIDPPSPLYTDYLRENYVRINGYLELYDGALALLPGQEYGSCLPATILAVNRGTAHEETSREFMEFVFSGEFQGSTKLFGFPVNRYAYKMAQMDTRTEEERQNMAAGSIAIDRWMNDYYYYDWPSAEAFKRLDSLLDQVTHVNTCDSQVYETVLRLGQGALKGEATIEETVDAIEKELQIYLAE